MTVVFFNDTATTEIYTLSLHDALPIYQNVKKRPACSELRWAYCNHKATYFASYLTGGDCLPDDQDRKSGSAGMPRPISYAVFCLKKKTHTTAHTIHSLSRCRDRCCTCA